MFKLLSIYLALAAFKFSPHEENYKLLLTHITKQYAHEIKESHQATLEAAGGQLISDVKVVSLTVAIQSTVNLSEARKIYLDLIEMLLSDINSNRHIRPFLTEYPLTYKNLSIILEFTNADGELVSDEGKVCIVGYGKEKIYYSINNEGHKGRTLHTESYEDDKDKGQ